MTKRQSRISIFPSESHVQRWRKRLFVFPPHELSALIESAGSGEDAVFNKFISEYRRRNEKQLQSLLRELGVDPSKPDAWARGFFKLAQIMLGVGRIRWHVPRTNRNSSTWTNDNDLELLRLVIVLKSEGLSERQAIKKIAGDPKLRKTLPYRPKGHFSAPGESRRRETALRSVEYTEVVPGIAYQSDVRHRPRPD